MVTTIGVFAAILSVGRPAEGCVLVQDANGRALDRIGHILQRLALDLPRLGWSRGSGPPAPRAFVTKGDANRLDDPWLVPAAGHGWAVAFVVPVLGYLLVALQTPAARLALVTLPVLSLGALILIDLWRPGRRLAETAADGA